jgi:hypothetical protein
MYRFRALLPLIVIALFSISLVGSISAQDATATPEGSTDGTISTLTNCDSSVVLLYGLAQRYFGYTPSSASGLDPLVFEHGQYSPFFDMSNVPSTSGTDMTVTEEPMATAEVMTTPEAGSVPPMSSVLLNPPLIAGEDPSCTLLRSDLDAFFTSAMMNPDWDNNFRHGIGGTGSTAGN